MKKKIETENKQLTSQFEKLGCRNIGNIKDQDPSLKLQLLNNTTYQQCIYRFYLKDYLINAYNNNYQSFLTANTKTGNSDQEKAAAKARTDRFMQNINTTEKITSFF